MWKQSSLIYTGSLDLYSLDHAMDPILDLLVESKSSDSTNKHPLTNVRGIQYKM